MYFDKLYFKETLSEIYEPYRKTLIELTVEKYAVSIKTHPQKYHFLVIMENH